MKFPPYPRSKPGGVEWLGDVPEHWEVKRGRFAMRVNPPDKILSDRAEWSLAMYVLTSRTTN